MKKCGRFARHPTVVLTVGYVPPHAAVQSSNITASKTKVTCQARSRAADVEVGRRDVLKLAGLLLATATLPQEVQCRPKPNKALVVSLLPLVRARDSLKDLSDSIVDGTTNGDLRRIIQTLLVGNKLKENMRDSFLWLAKDDAEAAQVHGREALEYLDQVIAYYDTTDLKSKPRGDYMNFALKAIDAARTELDRTLVFFPQTEVQSARRQLTVTAEP